jgi:hypothetical protein
LFFSATCEEPQRCVAEFTLSELWGFFASLRMRRRLAISPQTIPNPSVTTGEPGIGARRWPLRPIRFRPEGAACRGEAAPRPYLRVAAPHVIDGLETIAHS